MPPARSASSRAGRHSMMPRPRTVSVWFKVETSGKKRAAIEDASPWESDAGAASSENAQWSVLPIAAVLAGTGTGLFIAGLLGLIVSATLSTWTEQGEREAADWKGFAGYLKGVAKGKDDMLDLARFDRYLPYAAGFGLGESWVKRYEKQSGFAVPPWFQALRPDESSAAFVAVMVASHASFNSSGGGAAGAAGASGGGASGAG